MNTGKKLGICVFILLLLGFSQSMRAQDFTPQTGTWVINEEANGEPGRGFQIEVQNDMAMKGLVTRRSGWLPGPLSQAPTKLPPTWASIKAAWGLETRCRTRSISVRAAR